MLHLILVLVHVMCDPVKSFYHCKHIWLVSHRSTALDFQRSRSLLPEVRTLLLVSPYLNIYLSQLYLSKYYLSQLYLILQILSLAVVSYQYYLSQLYLSQNIIFHSCICKNIIFHSCICKNIPLSVRRLSPRPPQWLTAAVGEKTAQRGLTPLHLVALLSFKSFNIYRT